MRLYSSFYYSYWRSHSANKNGTKMLLQLLYRPDSLLSELPNTVHSFSRHGVVAARLSSAG